MPAHLDREHEGRGQRHRHAGKGRVRAAHGARPPPGDHEVAPRDGRRHPRPVQQRPKTQVPALADQHLDLVIWLRLLHAALQAKRLASVRPIDSGHAVCAQYGWNSARFGRLCGHTGELPGCNTFMGHHPDIQVTPTIWTNLASAADGRDPATAATLVRRIHAAGEQRAGSRGLAPRAVQVLSALRPLQPAPRTVPARSSSRVVRQAVSR